VIIGLMGGASAEIALGALLQKRASVIGTVLRSRPLEEKAALAQAFSHAALPLFARGVLRPVVDSVLPMEDVQEAHRRMEQNDTFGKIVLSW
jgi:NADPH:quinone reductase